MYPQQLVLVVLSDLERPIAGAVLSSSEEEQVMSFPIFVCSLAPHCWVQGPGHLQFESNTEWE